MLHQLMEFYVAFQVCCYLLGLTKSISMLLQGSNMERCCAYEIITNAQAAFEDIPYNSENEFHNLYTKASSIAKRALRKKCPYSELFWSVFSRIRTEYGEILCISPYSVRMRENTDQNNT